MRSHVFRERKLVTLLVRTQIKSGLSHSLGFAGGVPDGNYQLYNHSLKVSGTNSVLQFRLCGIQFHQGCGRSPPGTLPIWPMWEVLRTQHTISLVEPLAMIGVHRDFKLSWSQAIQARAVGCAHFPSRSLDGLCCDFLDRQLSVEPCYLSPICGAHDLQDTWPYLTYGTSAGLESAEK